ncbi:MAG: 23S rRNA (pseudouridine(1915)-N(3))-methyltransferase RlmH [Pseudomonadota bacterium]
MKLIIRAGGTMRSGPERELVDDYLQRAQQLSRNVGFLGVEEQSVDLSKCRSRSDETRKLIDGLPDQASLFVLDERGKALTSRKFASTLADQRNLGFSHLVFLIGGADGFEPNDLPAGARKISFGVQTWPHKLVRVMLAEQIYRGLGILAGTPYHRD